MIYRIRSSVAFSSEKDTDASVLTSKKPHAMPGHGQDATPVETEEGGHICIAQFEATVRQGPDAGTAYVGTLAIGIWPSGAIDEGVMAMDDGTSISVVGQAEGHAVNLLFTVADGQYLFGVGTSESNLADCNGVLEGTMGGLFVGPQPGESGDWIIRLLPKMVSTPTSARSAFVTVVRRSGGRIVPGITAPIRANSGAQARFRETSPSRTSGRGQCRART